MAINACITVCDLISDRAFAMYAGNTVPTEWPRRADRSTYETYAKVPSWNVEEAASLAAGLIPRQNFHRNFRPIHSVPEEPKPYEDAKTCSALLDETEPVGRVMSLLARARGVSNWAFSGSDLFRSPWHDMKTHAVFVCENVTALARPCGTHHPGGQ